MSTQSLKPGMPVPGTHKHATLRYAAPHPPVCLAQVAAAPRVGRSGTLHEIPIQVGVGEEDALQVLS